MLQVQDLYCERQRRILFERLSFSVRPGELLQIKGSNGSGKTTLLKILTGLYEDYTGEVDWDLTSWPLFVSHKPGVKDQLTALENLEWLAGLHQGAVDRLEVDRALLAVGLAGYQDVLCGTMSEGQRKRVNLARLFFVNSPAWILDEPLSAIYVEGVRLLQERIGSHLDDGGLVIVTSHQPLDVAHDVRYLDLSDSS
jgi:heme exporter protein A